MNVSPSALNTLVSLPSLFIDTGVDSSASSITDSITDSTTAVGAVEEEIATFLAHNCPHSSTTVLSQCVSALYLEEKHYALKDILTLCRGLPSTEVGGVTHLAADCDEEPWKSIKPSVRPSNLMLRSEVDRRWVTFYSSEITPRNKSWTMAQCNTWLDSHPISTPADQAYLQGLYRCHRNDAIRAAEEAIAERHLLGTTTTTTRGLPWTMKEAYLRLIHCLVDFDHIRSLFIRRNVHSRSRMELDGRNSENRPRTVWEEIAVKWNDVEFEAETILVEMHEDYRTIYNIPHSSIAGLIAATPEGCKEKITNMLVNLGRIIDRWERSGQGDGGFEPEDDDDEDESQQEFGSFHTRTHGALASRAAFLRDRPPYLLYFWQVLVDHDLLATSVARIDPSVAGPNGAHGVPSITGSTKKKKRGADDIGLSVLAKSVQLLAGSQESAAMIEANMLMMNNLTNVYLTTKIERSKLQLQLCDPVNFANDSYADMLQQLIDERYEEMNILKRQIKECENIFDKQRATGEY